MSKRKAKHAGLTVVKRRGDVVSRVVAILEQARAQVVRTVNSAQVVANWLVGREIVEAEQAGNARRATVSGCWLSFRAR